MPKTFPIIYKRTSKGQVQCWKIISDKTSYHTEEGVVGGTISINKPHIVEAKNLGKSNETNPEQQAEIESQAKWDKKLKSGYAKSIAEIDSVSFKKPMKGYKWREQAKKAKPPFQIQDKLNGVRYQAEEDASRSTGGEIFHTTPHIREELAPMFADYPELFVDGEAFSYTHRNHLNRLTELVSVCYKEKDLTPELLKESKEIVEFYVFDGFGFRGITETTPWIERHAAITKLIKEYAPKYVYALPYETVKTVKEIMDLLEQSRIEKREGLIIRWGDCPRKEGKSTQMLKLKNMEDEEFKIVDFEEGNGAYAGCVKAVILELNEPSTRGETTFRSNIDGDIEWLRELWVNKNKYIGEDATTEFQNYSEY